MWNTWTFEYEAQRPKSAAELRRQDARTGELAKRLTLLARGARSWAGGRCSDRDPSGREEQWSTC